MFPLLAAAFGQGCAQIAQDNSARYRQDSPIGPFRRPGVAAVSAREENFRGSRAFDSAGAKEPQMTEQTAEQAAEDEYDAYLDDPEDDVSDWGQGEDPDCDTGRSDPPDPDDVPIPDLNDATTDEEG
jgi:hypothetical protein